MGRTRLERDLPTLPGARLDPHRLQRDRQEPCRNLFARSHNRIILTFVVQLRSLINPRDQLIGRASHRRYDNSNFVAGIRLAFHVTRDIPYVIKICDGGSAEFHHDNSHRVSRWGALCPEKRSEGRWSNPTQTSMTMTFKIQTTEPTV